MVYEADIHSAQRIEEKRRPSLVYKGGGPHLIFRGVSRVCLKTGRSAWVKERYNGHRLGMVSQCCLFVPRVVVILKMC